MKILHIKVIYKIDGATKTSEATVPYVLSSEQKLPNIYPFNQNVYFGPDSGAFLGVVHINENGNIYYMDDIIVLKDNKATYSPFKNERYVFEFEVIEK